MTASPQERVSARYVGSINSGTFRSPLVDTLRGLAIVLMILDHLAILVPGGEVYRITLGRLAAPIFFLVSGHVYSGLRWRHPAILVVGLFLPVYAAWLDVPNVLVVYVFGCLVLSALRRLGIPTWVFLALALTAAANHLVLTPNGFEPLVMVGLMILGQSLPRTQLTWLVAWCNWRTVLVLSSVGRHPLAWYVGHVLLLTSVVGVVAGAWS